MSTAPTSFGQERLWFTDRLNPASAAYHVSRAWRLAGQLDRDALHRAWHRLTERHESLRTGLAEQAGVPVQVVAATGPELALLDLSELDAEKAERRIAAELAEQAARPFPLAGPLARCTLLRRDDTDHVLVLVLHHAITDGWSARILADELAELYQFEQAGRAASLPPLPGQYRDFARWQREQAASPHRQRVLDRWKSILQPLPAAPVLPTEQARPLGPAPGGAMLHFDWGADLAAALHRLCQQEAVTPFVVLLSALSALLHRFTEEDRVVIGTPTAGRSRSEDEALIGYFVNTLPLVTDVSGEPTLRQLLHRAQPTLLDALDGQDVPFEQIVAAVNPPPDPSRHPLFDVMLILQSIPEQPPQLAGLAVTEIPIDNATAKFDLTFSVQRLSPGLAGWVEYRTDLFSPAAAGRLLDQLRTLLTAALAQPDRPVTQLPLDTAEQLAALVTGADATTDAPDHEQSIPDLVRRWAVEQPDAIAVHGAEPVSYRGLVGRAEQIAARLVEAGVQPGSPVAVRLPAGSGLVATLLGILDAGCHFLCLTIGMPPETARQVLIQASPAALILPAGADRDDLVGWFAAELGGPILSDQPEPGGPARTGRPGTDVSPEPAALAYLAFTSGSTGAPKGIAYSQRGLTQFAGWLAGQFGLTPGRRVAQWAAAGYDAAYGEIFATLLGGATLCPVPDQLRTDPDRLGGWLASSGVHVLQTVPTFAAELAHTLAGSSIDTLLLAGEVLSGQLVARLQAALPAARLANLYGPSETILASWHEVDRARPGPVPIGRSIGGRQVLVLDPAGQPCPAGVIGELAVHTPYPAQCYVGQPAATAAAFTRLPGLPHVVYRTGDLGRWRADGLLDFLGRRDQQIKLRGARLELAELQAVLEQHPTVRTCAIIARRGPDGLVERLVAYVVPVGPHVGVESDWRTHLRSRFPEPSLPEVFVVLPELPRTSSGKVDPARLPDPEPVSPAGRAPQTELERELVELCKQVLGRGLVGVEENFFAAGGHSLLATRLLNQVRDRYGVDVALRTFFADPTVAGLAQAVQTPKDDADALDELLAQISALSDEEARHLVAQHDNESR